MTEILLFHHIQGLTPGVVAFADVLRAAGHRVHTPDLFGGQTFPAIEDGFAFTNSDDAPDFDTIADTAAAELPVQVLYAGFSWGVMRAQRLAQTRQGGTGALLFESCAPISGEWAFGPWPEGLPVQIHGMEDDVFFAEDIEAARELVATVGEQAELFVYPGNKHLFVDNSLTSYDPAAAKLLTQRTLDFLDRV